jgi:hypothetical protein
MKRTSTRTAALVFAAVVFALMLSHGSRAIDVATDGNPTINTTFQEQVMLRGLSLANAQSAQAFGVNPTLPGGGIVEFNITTFITFFTKATMFLPDATYNFNVLASDLSNNIGSYPWSFQALFAGQTITLIEPPFGGTMNTVANFTIESEFPSECRYEKSGVLSIDPVVFNTMTPFPATGGGDTLHTITDVFSALGATPPVENEKIPIAIACQEITGGRITPKALSITFLTEPPDIDPPPDGWDFQTIQLVSPANGIMTDANASLVIASERGSTCRYGLSSTMVTTSSGFTTLKAFDTTNTAKTQHTKSSFAATIGAWQTYETKSIAVTCDDGTALSYTLFPIMYVPSSVQRNLTITLVAPPDGVTESITTPFTVRTDKAAECRYDLRSSAITTAAGFDTMIAFSSVSQGQTQYSLADFYAETGTTPQADNTVFVAVTCRVGSEYTPSVFAVNYRKKGSTLFFDPIIVNDPNKPIAYITVRANQDVWCSLDGSALAGPKREENFNRTVSGQYSEPGGTGITNRTVTICCENRVGLQTCLPQQIIFRYFDRADITVTSPAASKTTSYQLTFTTNKLATCTARSGGPTGALRTLTPGSTTAGNAFSSAPITLANGKNDFFIECRSTVGTLSNKTFSVSVDNVKPVVRDIDTQGKTCDLDDVRFSINATDPEPSSGIVMYQYALYNGTSSTYLAEPTNTTDPQNIRVRHLKLANGQIVRISIVAWDGAGNPSAAYQENVKATDESDVSCDRTAPDIVVLTVKNGTRTDAVVSCYDEGSGCTTTFRYELRAVSEGGACTVTNSSQTKSYNQPIPVSKESFLCYLGLDKAGNEERGIKRVVLDATSTPFDPPIVLNGSCTDGVKNQGESDIDCGGYACGTLLKPPLKCDAGKKCVGASDCASGVCTAGVCGGNSCSNGVKDGSESDIDCGGTCGACSDGKMCLAQTDCERGTRCTNGFCLVLPEANEPAQPTTETDETSSGGMSFMKLLLIGLGILLLVGGTGGAIVYDPGRGFGHTPTRTTPTTMPPLEHEPIARFPPRDASKEHGDELTSDHTIPLSSEVRKRRQDLRREERESRLKAFDSADDLTSMNKVNHHHVEQAMRDLSSTEAVKAIKQLATDDKLSHKDAAIVVQDLKEQPQHADAIEALRNEFNIDTPAAAPRPSKPKSVKKTVKPVRAKPKRNK